jgi:iron complex outermembrane recepter protein
VGLLVTFLLPCCGVIAQRTEENAVTSAPDAFGSTIGSERIGLYDASDVRGFSPIDAGNARIEGLYFDRVDGFTARLITGATIRAGLGAHGYPFVAPTGIVDYTLRPAGDRPILSSVLSLGPFGTRALDLDAQLPLQDGRFNLAAGYSYRVEELSARGGGGVVLDRALAPRVSVRDGAVEIRPFWARIDWRDYLRTPLIFLHGDALPPSIESSYIGQEWSSFDGFSEVSGAVLRSRLGTQWSVHSGLFRAESMSEGYLELYLQAQGNGSATHAVLVTPRQQTRSYSGELLLTRTWADAPLSQRLHLSWRGRNVKARYAGSSLAVLGTARIGESADVPEPSVQLSERTLDNVSQWLVGASYSALWPQHGEITLVLQRSTYDKQVRLPTVPMSSSRDESWLYSATLAVHATDRLILYAGRTTGLEESGSAPESASNYPDVAPASRTTQWDAGLRYAFNQRMRLIAGTFEIDKPYFNVDPTDRAFRSVGTVVHRGVELSLAGEATPALKIVLGAVFMDAQVSGALVDQGLVGPLPVGLPRRQVRVNADYRFPSWSAASVDFAVAHMSGEAAIAQNLPDGNRQLQTNKRTVWDVGGRYRFHMGRFPATLRVLVSNVSDEFAWNVSSGGALTAVDPRRVSAHLTVDFQ